MAANDEMMNLFSKYEDIMCKEQETREAIRIVVKEIEKISREMTAMHQRLHLPGGHEKTAEIICQTKILLESSQPLFKKLAKTIPPNQFYKYHDSWKFVTQKMVFSVALMFYLENQELLGKEKAAELLSLGKDNDGFDLCLEDYLVGLLDLVSELARFAVTCATFGDYTRPLHIAKFVSQLNAGFMLMNFKNDFLRKRYDVLKYDQKKIEEVVFDLSIRGLRMN